MHLQQELQEIRQHQRTIQQVRYLIFKRPHQRYKQQKPRITIPRCPHHFYELLFNDFKASLYKTTVIRKTYKALHTVS